MKNIRNFCIIAHIDHGKSTLADRFLEITNTLTKREMKHGQHLDTMDIEQERGITIKLQPVRMNWEKAGVDYILNLIDTPGHVDFQYEVSRSLAACEGAILVVDAAQGIEAQTLANCYMAMEHNLTIIPVLNKIDLPAADVEKVTNELVNTLGVTAEEIISISAKEGTNVAQVLDEIIERIPPPNELNDELEGQTKALIFDSIYDTYKGVVAFVRVFEGSIKKGDRLKLLNTRAEFEALEVGYFKPKFVKTEKLYDGEVGYIVTGFKSVGEARVGDTVWQCATKVNSELAKALPGYKTVQPFVFASIFCTDGDDYQMLRDAMEKLSLNDSAFTFEPEQSPALGHGFRCGFLGLLHLEIVQERLEREYDLDLIVTAPSVSYYAVLKDGSEEHISSPSDLPDTGTIEQIKEPWVKTEIITPKEYLGGIMELVTEKRGISKSMQYIDENRVLLLYEMPLGEIVIDFYDRLKSISAGYASMNYEHLDYRPDDLVKLDILLAGEAVDALSIMIHKSNAFRVGSSLTKKLKELIPRAQFEISIQAAVGSRVLARETLPALRKDVTAKLYGGDRSRKDKLLKKQKAGKKRMKKVGKVDLPQAAFLAILKRD
ncbi:translation elongation factor 4 [Patescibacteria group bacterium]|nr:translation elongation factor 4 [Patescibacteria group bacterium]